MLYNPNLILVAPLGQQLGANIQLSVILNKPYSIEPYQHHLIALDSNSY
jgi:hypothetical protein